MAGETIRDVTIRVKLKLESEKIVAPELAALQKQVERTTAETARISAGANATTREHISLKRQSYGETMREFMLEQRRERARDQSIRALIGLGRGAAQVIRGVALAFMDVDEDSGEFLKTLTNIQAGFDTFSGAVETIGGVTNALDSMKKMSIMAGTAQKGLAASNMAVASSAGGARAAMLAFTASGGPMMIALAAVAAVGATLYTQMSAMSELRKKISEGIKADRADWMGKLEVGMGGRSAQLSGMLERNLLGAGQSPMEQLEARLGGTGAGLSVVKGQLADLNRSMGAFKAPGFGAGGGSLFEMRRGMLEAKRAEFEQRQRDLEKMDSGPRQREKFLDAIGRGSGSQIARDIEALEKTTREAGEQELRLQEQIRSKLGEQKRLLEDERQIKRDILEFSKQEAAAMGNAYSLAKQRYDEEKRQQEDTAARGGMMSGGVRRRLDRIAEKLTAGGTATKSELRFLMEHGGEAGQMLGRQGFATTKGGKDFLATDDKLRALTGKMGSESAADRLRTLATPMEGLKKAYEEEFQKYQDVGAAIKGFLDKNTEALDSVIKKIEEVEGRIVKLTDAVKAKN